MQSAAIIANTIRPHVATSLRIQGEVQTGAERLLRLAKTPWMNMSPTVAKGPWKSVTLGGQQRSDDGARQVFGGGMRGRWRHVNQGDLPANRPGTRWYETMNRAGRSQSVHSSEEAG
jgi:hypothetical protein